MRHPWELARGEFFLRLLDSHGLLADDRSWLDVGAGDGWFAVQLRRLLSATSTVTCWDINYTEEDLEILGAQDDGVTFVVARPAERFDRVLMLDVIEHTEDDVGFIASVVEDALADEGMLLASVPAYPSLYGSHDRALRHHRRYSPATCRRALEEAGLAVVAGGGLFASLLPMRAAEVLVERVRTPPAYTGGIGSWQRGRLVTGAVTRGLVWDGRLSLALSQWGMAAPGLSYWALCRRQTG